MSLCDSCIHASYKAAPEPGKKPEDYPLCVAFHWLNEIITEFNEQVGARAYPIRDADIHIDVAECVGYVSNGQEKPEAKVLSLVK